MSNAYAFGNNALVGGSNTMVLGGTGGNAVKVVVGATNSTNPVGSITATAGLAASVTSDLITEYRTQVTFTPSLIGETTAGTPTYGTRSGQYSRIGGIYDADIELVLTALGGGSGNASISGLPIASIAGSNTKRVAVDWSNVTRPANAVTMFARIAAGTTTAQLFWTNTTGAASRVQIADLSATTELRFGAHYTG